jgi:hypothetical protein
VVVRHDHVTVDLGPGLLLCCRRARISRVLGADEAIGAWRSGRSYEWLPAGTVQMIMAGWPFMTHTRLVPRYRVSIQALPPSGSVGAGPGPLRASVVVRAPSAQAAVCDLADYYLSAGLVVDWSVRRTGLRRLVDRSSGRLHPGDDDGLAGVREPRRPLPSSGSASAAA